MTRTRRVDGGNEKGLTLIEILVVMSVVGLLVALLLPTVQGARESARRAQCGNHLRQIGLAVHQYHGVHGSLPIGLMPAFDRRYYTLDPPCVPDFLDRSCLIGLLPYVEQAALFDAINANLDISSRENRTCFRVSVAVYACPSDRDSVWPRPIGTAGLVALGMADLGERLEASYTSYVACHGTFPVYALPTLGTGCRVDPRTRAQADGCFTQPAAMPLAAIRDGLSHTLFFAERATGTLREFEMVGDRWGWYFVGNWGDTLFATFAPPNAWRKSDLPLQFGVSSRHPAGVNVLMGDGAVRFVADSIDSWPFDYEAGVAARYTMRDEGWWSGPSRPGVWQALGTRAGGEPNSD